jgi:DNA polymerase
MPVLIRDYETRGKLDLRDVGAWRYTTDSATDVLCCSFAVDDGPIKLWVPGDPVPEEFIEAARNPEWLISAFNDGFERLVERHIMAARYNWPAIPIVQHRCLQAAALALALPASLENVAEVLKLSNQKDKAGQKTMMKMAKPRRPRPGEDPTGIYWHDEPDELAKLHAYCRRDVAVERELHGRIGPLSADEQALWQLDAQINDRGICIDGPLVDAALRISEAAGAEINAELVSLTAGEVTTVGQTDRIAKWLAAHDCPVTNLQKGTLQRALTRKAIPPEARRVIELRLGGAHAAASKLTTMRAWRNEDGRARGVFRFNGASTGRWTSFGIQLQNLKRSQVDDLGTAIAAVATGDINQVRKLHAHPMSVVGDITRGLIIAAPGHRLIIGDLSGIESRVTAFISGQQSKLEQWARFDQTQKPEDEPYYLLGRSLGFREAEARDLGKVADLAFGYQGGVGAWQKLAPPDDGSTEEQIKARQHAWRRAHPRTAQFWNSINRASIWAMQRPGQRIECDLVAFEYDGREFLRLRLPSGRNLAYPFPRLERNGFDNLSVIYQDNVAGRWTECRHGHGAYGGLWTENIVQAVARDLFAAALQRLEAAGYPIVLHVHDEIVAEVPDGFGSVEEFQQLITQVPAWAEGLPVAAKVRDGPRFAKINKPGTPRGDAAAAAASNKANSAEADARSSNEPPRGNGRDTESNDYASGERPWGRAVADYIYRTATGEPYLRVTRSSAKQFWQARWENSQWVSGKPAGPKIPFRLPELLAAPVTTAVWVAEGEKDAENVAALGLIATTNSEGAGKWAADLNRWFVGKTAAYILEDNDDAGRKHAAQVAMALRGIVPDIRVVHFPELDVHGDVSDWVAAGGTCEQLIERAKAAPKFVGTTLNSARASTYKPSAVQWIWPGRFAIGKLGIIAGLPEEGKGQILCDVAARITRALLWPCNEGCAPQGNVVLLTAEDAIEDTVVPRLLAAGADLSRIEIVRMAREQDKERMFSLVTDLDLLRETVLGVGDVRMIQIDPISAYLGIGKIDSFRTPDVRAVLGPVAALAEDLKVSVLGVLHFNKKTDVSNVMLRISDSLAFAATSRHVYGVVSDPENKRKLFVKGKNNLAPYDQKVLAYNFEVREVGKDDKTDELIIAPHVVWHPQYIDVTAVEAMQAAAELKSPAARDSAKSFLKELLNAGPVCKSDIEEAAEANGIASRTLRRAQADLKIQAVKDGPLNTEGRPTWRWYLPPDAEGTS